MSWLQRHIRPEQVRELSLLLIIILAVIVFGSIIDGYYTSRTFNRIATSVAIVTVIGVGMTLVVLTRNIDLSVGSIVGCTAYFTGVQLAADPNLGALTAIAIAMGLGLLMGAINGVIVAWGRVPSIIVTLGTLAIYRGILIDYSGAKTVTTDSLPPWLVDLPQIPLFTIGGVEIRAIVVLALIVVVVFQLLLSFFNFGRGFYAIGSNPDAAALVGLPKERIIFTAFALSGALAGLAGFMFLARFGNITVEAGRGLELQVVAAVVVGGVNIFGGSGTVIGAMLGAVMIGTLEQSLFRLQINEFWRDAILGLLILLAVASDAVLLNRLRALWARADMRLVARPTSAVGDEREVAP
jgi:rhamnose transport system permease protein